MIALNSTTDTKKSDTILTPHLELLGSGGMVIEFENMATPHDSTKPLKGRILLYLQEGFLAKNIIINLIGHLRTLFKGQESQEEIRLAETIVNVDYMIADFDDDDLTDPNHQGMYEYPFVIDLPEEVIQSTMIKTEKFKREASQQFFLKAQVTPLRNNGMATTALNDVSLLRTDTTLLCYLPDDEGDRNY